MNLLIDKPYLVLGGGGHSTVVIDLLVELGADVVAVLSSAKSEGAAFSYRKLPIFTNDEYVFESLKPSDIYLALGVGDQLLRKRLYNQFTSIGYQFPVLKHPFSWVSASSTFGPGTQIMAGAVVQARCRIGVGCIVNTSSSIDHDCSVSDFCHIAPGAHLCGGIDLGNEVHIGAGATVIQEIKISADNLIKAGSCIKRNII